MNVLLISTYEMGRQPFGLASPAAWLREAGAQVRCVDLAIETLPEGDVQAANLVAFYVPMHTATRLAVQTLPQVRALNPQAHVCCYGLYASENADYLRSLGVDSLIGGEFESGLVALYERLRDIHARATVVQATGSATTSLSRVMPSEARHLLWRPSRSRSLTSFGMTGESSEPRAKGFGRPNETLRFTQSDSQDGAQQHNPSPFPIVSLDRQAFKLPDRAGLPALDRYAHLVLSDGTHRVVGYVEASRGCKHLCRHCPIVPVYGGRFRVVQREVVLADIRQQVAAGAQHITFGDPDFFNGPGHSLPIVRALHAEFPGLTYDVTIKVEHLLRYAEHLPTLKATGCLFIISAVEAFDPRILALFDKQHTREEFETVLRRCDQAGLLLIPTFVAFTPWTTLDGYRAFLQEIARLGLADCVAPIQYAIRLLIPPGSRLLELPDTQATIEGLDQARLTYTWRNPDSAVDILQRDLERLAQSPLGRRLARRDFFRLVWDRVHDAAPPPLPPDALAVPYMSEPWYC
ncbi:MAG: radical SAM protein [Anaerolineae bacterium]|nr:radical SAM protein [Anaerolineae bacterium]